MIKKMKLAINMAVSLAKSGEFFGLDEESQRNLSNFLECLSENEIEYFQSKLSEDAVKRIHSLFDIEVHQATMLVFDLDIPVKNKSLFDPRQATVIGLVKNTIITSIAFEKFDSLIIPHRCKMTIMAEIDHEKIRDLEKTNASMEHISKDFSVYFPGEEIEVKKRFI